MQVEISKISSKAFSPASSLVITCVIAAARKNTFFGTSNNIAMTPHQFKGPHVRCHHQHTPRPMNSLHGTVGARRELLLDIK